MTGAADVHLDHDGRAAICGDVNAVGRVNNEGLVNGVVALEGLTGIRVGHILVRPLLDCGVLDMHSGLAGGRVKSEPGRARRSTTTPAAAPAARRTRASTQTKSSRSEAQASSDAVKREAEMNGRGFRSERGSVIM